MSDMVERVARAIYETDPVGVRPWADAPTSNREDCLVCARAAIAAMQEPTVEMTDAAQKLDWRGPIADAMPGATLCFLWREMIDEALK